MTERLPCITDECPSMILPETAAVYSGMCPFCARGQLHPSRVQQDIESLRHIGEENDLEEVELDEREEAEVFYSSNQLKFTRDEGASYLITEEIEHPLFDDEISIFMEPKSDQSKTELANTVDNFISMGKSCEGVLRGAILEYYLKHQEEKVLKPESSLAYIFQEIDIFDELSAQEIEGVGYVVALEYSSHLDGWKDHVVLFKNGNEIIYAGLKSNAKAEFIREASEFSSAPQPIVDEVETPDFLRKRKLSNFQRIDEGTTYRASAERVSLLFNSSCHIELDEFFEEDENKGDYFIATENFLKAEVGVLKAVEKDLYQYYEDCIKGWGYAEGEYEKIDSPSNIWKHIGLANTAIVTRDDEDDQIYISLECGCSWEEEHGLQIVLKNGEKVCKIGGYDGHNFNSDNSVIYERF